MTDENIVVVRDSRKYKTLVTNIGKAKTAKAALEGEKVNIITAVAGDGGGAYYIPTDDMTQVKNEVWRGEIANKKINDKSANMVDVKVILDGTVGGFTVREVGLLDDEGDLIVICNIPDTEKVVILDGIASSLTLLLHVVFTNVDAVHFDVSPSIDNVTDEDLQAGLKKAIQAHNETGHASTELIRIDHGLRKYPLVIAGLLQYGAGMGGAGEAPAGGSDIVQAPARAVFHSADSLTVYTTEAVARPGTAKEVRRISSYEYIVTYEGNGIDSVYIRLI